MKIGNISKNYYHHINAPLPKAQNKKGGLDSSNLKCDTFSFGRKKGSYAKYRENQVRDIFNKNGFEYISRNNVWNTQKIYKTLDKISEQYDEILKDRKPSNKDLNAMVAKTLPQNIARKIFIGDYDDYKKCMEDIGFSEEYIKQELNTNGMQCATEDGGSAVFINRKIYTTNRRLQIILLMLALDKFPEQSGEICDKIKKQFAKIPDDKKLNSEDLNEIMQNSLPEDLKSSIEIKNLDKDFKEYLHNKHGLSYETIDGSNSCCINKTKFYIDIERQEKLANLREKATFLHELKHSLTKLCTNTRASERNGLSNNFCNIYGGIFRNFELQTRSDLDLLDIDDNHCERNLQSLVKSCGYSSEEELINSLNDNFNNIVSNTIANNKHLSKYNTFASKAFWNYMKLRAKDEKEAYHAESIMENHPFINNERQYNFELVSLLYGEMEKLFARRIKESTH